MNYQQDHLDRIYNRTSGYCHICHKKLARRNYARYGKRGAWEVDHSRARSNGGSDHGNNLFAACISCNREKKAESTVTARNWHGKSRAPLSRDKRNSARFENGILGAAAAGACGGALLDPAGALIGGLIGAWLGGTRNPDKS